MEFSGEPPIFTMLKYRLPIPSPAPVVVRSNRSCARRSRTPSCPGKTLPPARSCCSAPGSSPRRPTGTGCRRSAVRQRPHQHAVHPDRDRRAVLRHRLRRGVSTQPKLTNAFPEASPPCAGVSIVPNGLTAWALSQVMVFAPSVTVPFLVRGDGVELVRPVALVRAGSSSAACSPSRPGSSGDSSDRPSRRPAAPPRRRSPSPMKTLPSGPIAAGRSPGSGPARSRPWSSRHRPGPSP